jgi:hypothetical protein
MYSTPSYNAQALPAATVLVPYRNWVHLAYGAVTIITNTNRQGSASASATSSLLLYCFHLLYCLLLLHYPGKLLVWPPMELM